jgi:hypothetical protein
MQLNTIAYVAKFVGIAVNAAVLYYIIKLEAEHCKCIRDWRHTFIKVFTMVSIGISVLLMTPVVSMMMLPVLMGLLAVMTLISVVNVYAFFTYVGDLNNTQCACAVSEMSGLNKGMLVLRWVYVVGIVFSIIGMLRRGTVRLALPSTASYKVTYAKNIHPAVKAAMNKNPMVKAAKAAAKKH